ncbi:tripartite tricarboxylate transporter substrate-binding protein [Tritonibacter scottomollicae]|uniref:tripartite tricarboxylate transporter substrate-binding protein n=1 Tax=Tritonibacter scottomollicae TaxID=483013 RepID=UPI003BAA6466
MATTFLRKMAKGVTVAILPLAAHADDLGWAPDGPVDMIIAFQAGGGADSLARLMAEEISTRHGWNIIPRNVPGRGGGIAAQEVAGAPNDGSAIGFTVSEALTYTLQATRDPGYKLEDFDFLTSITGTQMGMVSKPDRGFDTIEDMIEAARGGETVTIGAMTQKLADAAYVLGKSNEVEFTIVMTEGGRGGINAVMASDVDAAWVAGAQSKSVASGDLVNLASAESTPLRMSPDAPLLNAFNFPYDLGVRFLTIAPDGIPEEAQTAWNAAIAEVLADPESPLTQLTERVFSGPDGQQGADLEAAIQQSFDDAGAMLEASAD